MEEGRGDKMRKGMNEVQVRKLTPSGKGELFPRSTEQKRGKGQKPHRERRGAWPRAHLGTVDEKGKAGEERRVYRSWLQ